MDTKLLSQALGKLGLGVVLVALLLFLPAGSLRFWNGWLLMVVLFIPMLGAGLVMFFKAPELLRAIQDELTRDFEEKCKF